MHSYDPLLGRSPSDKQLGQQYLKLWPVHGHPWTVVGPEPLQVLLRIYSRDRVFHFFCASGLALFSSLLLFSLLVASFSSLQAEWYAFFIVST
ncbi:hypothetical protein JZ751_008838 [Albula glossodonta]|uniref:Uncharacterized protein n=1 Tax=Albula glossodonta TaxID=121402 RepID=A0A8T2NZU0_9TELE|nr:hypothetical protein JZ751_008838 [Albula glossodonta]